MRKLGLVDPAKNQKLRDSRRWAERYTGTSERVQYDDEGHAHRIDEDAIDAEEEDELAASRDPNQLVEADRYYTDPKARRRMQAPVRDSDFDHDFAVTHSPSSSSLKSRTKRMLSGRSADRPALNEHDMHMDTLTSTGRRGGSMYGDAGSSDAASRQRTESDLDALDRELMGLAVATSSGPQGTETRSAGDLNQSRYARDAPSVKSKRSFGAFRRRQRRGAHTEPRQETDDMGYDDLDREILGLPPSAPKSKRRGDDDDAITDPLALSATGGDDLDRELTGLPARERRAAVQVSQRRAEPEEAESAPARDVMEYSHNF